MSTTAPVVEPEAAPSSSFCAHCGRPKDEVDFDRAYCGVCRSPRGKLGEIDIAIQTSSPVLVRIPEWKEIKYRLVTRFGHALNDQELWYRYTAELQFDRQVSRDEFLAWPIGRVVADLRCNWDFDPKKGEDSELQVAGAIEALNGVLVAIKSDVHLVDFSDVSQQRAGDIPCWQAADLASIYLRRLGMPADADLLQAESKKLFEYITNVLLSRMANHLDSESAAKLSQDTGGIPLPPEEESEAERFFTEQIRALKRFSGSVSGHIERVQKVLTTKLSPEMASLNDPAKDTIDTVIFTSQSVDQSNCPLDGKIDTRVSHGMNVEDANQKALELAGSDPTFLLKTQRKWAEAIGCSPATVGNTTLWKQTMKRSDRGRKGKPPKPKLVTLTDTLESTLGKPDEEVTLERLIADQNADFESSPVDEIGWSPVVRH